MWVGYFFNISALKTEDWGIQAMCKSDELEWKVLVLISDEVRYAKKFLRDVPLTGRNLSVFIVPLPFLKLV